MRLKGMMAGVLILAFFLTGCSTTIWVHSNPEDARVLINGADTGMMTPAPLTVRELRTGRSYVTVEKEGYKTITPKQVIDVKISAGNVIWSIWPPVLIKNLCSNLWKGIVYPEHKKLADFQLEKVSETEPTGVNSVPVTSTTNEPLATTNNE